MQFFLARQRNNHIISVYSNYINFKVSENIAVTQKYRFNINDLSVNVQLKQPNSDF